MSQSWMIASGKGGVGKSTVTAALGISLAKRSIQCCCVDTDIGLRNLDMLMGMQNSVVYDLMDVAQKNCKLKLATLVHPTYMQLSLLPAAQLGSVTDISTDDMKRIVRKLKKHAAYVLLDAPAGVERGLQNLLPASDQAIIVTTPDDVAIRDAERLISLMDQKKAPRPMLIVNRVIPEMVTRGDMYSPQIVANTLDIPLLGYIPDDRNVIASLNSHTTFMDVKCPAHDAIDRIVQRFLGEFIPMPTFAKKRFFFSRKTY